MHYAVLTKRIDTYAVLFWFYLQEFNKNYTISGKDPIYIRYLLTQSMMDRLVDLKNYLGIAPRIQFIDDTILISIPSAKKFPKVDYKNIKTSLEKYFSEVGVVASIISILKMEEHHITINQLIQKYDNKYM